MNHQMKICAALTACLLSLVACRNLGTQAVAASAETRSGSNTSIVERPKQDVRKLRSTLPGKKMKDVVKLLGQPSQVFTFENRETWEYKNGAYDPVTGRTVRFLDIFFIERLVARVNFSY
jgi:outer membrane protein assembly factor BamE (lipoprotein component of BamABCDE complex)